MKIKRTAILFALPFYLILTDLAGLKAQTQLRILTAGKEGAYYSAAQVLNEVLKPQYDFIISTTSGSFYNIQRLGNGRADLAFAQSDALYLYITMGKSIANRCLVVAPLQYEYIHIIVNTKSDIKSFKDLKDKKIAVGRKFSGSWVSAFLILFSENNIKFENNKNIFTIPLKESIQMMIKDEIDAIFVTTIKGSPQLDNYFRQYGYRISLFTVGNDFSFAKRKVNRFYNIEKIKKRTYFGQKEDVYTAATPSYLLAYKYMNATTVKKLTQKIYKNAKELKKLSSVWELLNVSFAKKQMKRYIPYHRGSKNFIKSQ